MQGASYPLSAGSGRIEAVRSLKHLGAFNPALTTLVHDLTAYFGGTLLMVVSSLESWVELVDVGLQMAFESGEAEKANANHTAILLYMYSRSRSIWFIGAHSCRAL